MQVPPITDKSAHISLAKLEEQDRQEFKESNDELTHLYYNKDIFNIIFDMLAKNDQGQLANVNHFWDTQVNEDFYFKFAKNYYHAGVAFLEQITPKDYWNIQKFHFFPAPKLKVAQAFPKNIGHILNNLQNLKILHISKTIIDEPFLSCLMQCENKLEEISITQSSIENYNLQKFSEFFSQSTKLNKVFFDSLRITCSSNQSGGSEVKLMHKYLFTEFKFHSLTLKNHNLNCILTHLIKDDNSTLSELTIVDSLVRNETLIGIMKRCNGLKSLILNDVKKLDVRVIASEFPEIKIEECESKKKPSRNIISKS